MEFEVSQIQKSACGSVLTRQARRSALFFSWLAVSSRITAHPDTTSRDGSAQLYARDGATGARRREAVFE